MSEKYIAAMEALEVLAAQCGSAKIRAENKAIVLAALDRLKELERMRISFE